MFEILLQSSASLQAYLSVVLLNCLSLASWELLALWSKQSYCWSCCCQNNYSKCWIHMMQLNYWLVQFGPTKGGKKVVLCTDFLELRDWFCFEIALLNKRNRFNSIIDFGKWSTEIIWFCCKQIGNFSPLLLSFWILYNICMFLVMHSFNLAVKKF